MMRSLWTGASGMTSQQMNVDTISNNLANVNTFSYKKERTEFKTLLYQTMRTAGDTQANRNASPVNLQVGLGVRPQATAKTFDQGIFITTGIKTDFTISGEGFFVVDKGNGDICYTRDGSFKLSNQDDGLMLVTSEGYSVLSSDGEPIVFGLETSIDRVTVNRDGTVSYIDEEGQPVEMGFQIELVQFPNRQGLQSEAGNLYRVSPASGQPLSETQGEVTKRSELIQGSLEGSNVQVAEEMVNLIVAQRAYEINSKVITTSDDMLNTANQLKR